MNFTIPKRGQYIVLQNNTNILLAEGTDFMRWNSEKNYWELVHEEVHFFRAGIGFEIICYDYEEDCVILRFEDLPNSSNLLTRKIYDGRLFIPEYEFEKIDFELISPDVYDQYQTLGHDEFFKQTYNKNKEKEILVI